MRTGDALKSVSRRFSNPWPHDELRVSNLLKWKFGKLKDPPWPGGAGDDPAPWQALPREVIATPPVSGWRVSWLGHSSFLAQGAGVNLLFDPVFSDHCAPVKLKSLKRLVAVPCALEDLPKIDAVLLSHGHYDHLDLPTLRRLGMDTRLIVPEGHQGWLKARGFTRVTEARWYDTVEIAEGIRAVSTPAQHFSSRTPWDRDQAHWCGWRVEGGGVRLWHAGDTAWCPAFAEMAKRLGPVDLGMVPIGAYSPRAVMRSVHVDPEDALRVFQDAQCRRAIGMHWGTFRLTDEPMAEPPARLKAACIAAGVNTFGVLPAGGTVTVEANRDTVARSG